MRPMFLITCGIVQFNVDNAVLPQPLGGLGPTAGTCSAAATTRCLLSRNRICLGEPGLTALAEALRECSWWVGPSAQLEVVMRK